MKTRTMVVAAVVATGLFVTGAVAQHEEHHNDQATPPADKADTGKTGGMMSGNMMTQMPKMMMSQTETGIRAAEAQLAQAQAGLAQAELDFGRVSALWEQESVTKPAYDSSKARLDIARANVEAYKAAIAGAQKHTTSAEAQMHEAQIALGDTELRAPFTGILLERRVELGALAAAGTPAFTLADLESVKARFNVPDFALAGFRQGQTLMLSVLAFPGETFNGRVTRIFAPSRDHDIRFCNDHPGKLTKRLSADS